MRGRLNLREFGYYQAINEAGRDAQQRAQKLGRSYRDYFAQCDSILKGTHPDPEPEPEPDPEPEPEPKPKPDTQVLCIYRCPLRASESNPNTTGENSCVYSDCALLDQIGSTKECPLTLEGSFSYMPSRNQDDCKYCGPYVDERSWV
jgi:hypothetical protein